MIRRLALGRHRTSDGCNAGTRGTVVSADPNADSYTIETAEDEGRLVFATRLDVTLLQRARDRANNGR